MKILISACHFTPDPIGGGKFSGEMAEWLVAHGHEVRAVVGIPYYPRWQAADGYSAGRYRRETVRGVDVLRCPMWIPRLPSGLARLIQYGTLALTSLLPLLWWAGRWKPDVVWTTMPPFSGLPMTLAAAKIAGAPSWLHVQDFEIDAAFELGLLKAGFLKRIFLGLERRLMSAFTIVSTITNRMQDRLTEKGVLAVRQNLFLNWVDLDVIYPRRESDQLRAELSISPDAFVVLYSGNLGEKQGVDDLVEVARILSDAPDVLVVISGDGVGRDRLSALAENVSNIRFFALQPVERFNELLGMASVHLLPQKPEIADLVMPSKLPAMLASGRPVVAAAAPHTQLAREVEGCGMVVAPGNAPAMAAAIRMLRASPDLCSHMGEAAAERGRSRWSKSAILARFEADLVRLAASRKNPSPI